MLNEDGPGHVYPLDPARWLARACTVAGRDLTQAEWDRYLPDRPYRPVCDLEPRPASDVPSLSRGGHVLAEVAAVPRVVDVLVGPELGAEALLPRVPGVLPGLRPSSCLTSRWMTRSRRPVPLATRGGADAGERGAERGGRRQGGDGRVADVTCMTCSSARRAVPGSGRSRAPRRLRNGPRAVVVRLRSLFTRLGGGQGHTSGRCSPPSEEEGDEMGLRDKRAAREERETFGRGGRRVATRCGRSCSRSATTTGSRTTTASGSSAWTGRRCGCATPSTSRTPTGATSAGSRPGSCTSATRWRSRTRTVSGSRSCTRR